MSQTYYDDDLGLKLDMPDDWKTADNDAFQLILFAPTQEAFSANMTFSLRSLDPPRPETLGKVIAEARKERESDYKGFELVEEKKMRVDTYPAYWEVYNWVADENEVELTQMFVLILTHPEALFSIHATTLRAHADTYIPMFKTIIESFEFVDDDDD